MTTHAEPRTAAGPDSATIASTGMTVAYVRENRVYST
jgi:hypothetical protein